VRRVFELENIAIRLTGVSKKYHLYERPIDRLLAMAPWNTGKTLGKEFWALRDVDLEVAKGEVVGIIGRNGAGKSTLLQTICKTLSPSGGEVVVRGRVAALLELGSGFDPEFSGRENVYLSAAIAGLGRAETDALFDEIVEFAELGEFIDQSVKTYSSGMFVRLAFAVATSVSPDILVIDEALSVGDGAFARKSFDRIMKLKDGGCTILFCSHTMHQVETICSRVAWIDGGKIRSLGIPSFVIAEYVEELNKSSSAGKKERFGAGTEAGGSLCAKITNVRFYCDDIEDIVKIQSGKSDLRIEIRFSSDPSLPPPNVAITFDTADFRMATSATSYGEDEIPRDAEGNGRAEVTFPKIPLLRGKYFVSVYLMCEKCVHFYDSMPHKYEITVEQDSFEQGIFRVERRWSR
jgi:lipopolysaccharide transport system ATP-binding protein